MECKIICGNDILSDYSANLYYNQASTRSWDPDKRGLTSSISIYLVMGETLFVLGQEHSLINPSWYNYCIGADVLSFAVQVMGLAFAIWDVAGTGSVGQESDTGGRIIAGGTVIHALMLVVVLVIYVVALLKGYISWCETGYTTFNIERGGYKKCSTRFKVFLAAITVALLCLLARDVNRMIGFIQEFDGGNRNQARWAALDGLLVSEAVLGLVVLHPSYVFSDYNKKKKYSDGVRTPSSASYGRLARQVIV